MRILMLSPHFPFPSTDGGLVRISSIFKGLSQRFIIELITPIRPNTLVELPEQNSNTVIRPILVNHSRTQTFLKLARFGLTRTPLHCCLQAYPEVVSVVSRRLQRNDIDAIYCHFACSLEYLPRTVNIPIILDTQNDDQQYWLRKRAFSTGWKRIFLDWNLRKIKCYEQSYTPRIWTHVSVSNSDRQLAIKHTHAIIPNYLVAYNGVDTKKYTPGNFEQTSTSNGITLAFLGSLDLEINIDGALRLCTDILPIVQAKTSGKKIKLLIIGRNPPQILQEISLRNPNIIVTGTVPDVQPWLQQANIFVAPLYQGAGTKLRVLEAMACALPVIGTEMALQGLDGSDGVHFLCAKDDTQIIETILDLVSNHDKRIMIGKNARRLMETQYDWSMINKKLADQIEALRLGNKMNYPAASSGVSKIE